MFPDFDGLVSKVADTNPIPCREDRLRPDREELLADAPKLEPPADSSCDEDGIAGLFYHRHGIDFPFKISMSKLESPTLADSS